MDIEEISYEQAELFGEFPNIPTLWEETIEVVIADTTETSSVYRSAFQEEFEDGFI